MTRKMPFVGRTDELQRIRSLVKEVGARQVVCIAGAGGIGKTRLLEEVRKQITQLPMLVSPIIDFDDRTLFISDNLERTIAQQLGEKYFRPYLQALRDLRNVENSNVSMSTVNQLRDQMHDTFLQNYNALTQSKRVVLLFDTTDHILEREVWKRLQMLLPHLINTLVILAGRNAAILYHQLRASLGSDAQLLTLNTLREEKVDDVYLRQKQDQLYVSIDKALAEKVLALAQGRPIIIDLAVEWLARDAPDDWLLDASPEDIRAHQAEFEAELVQHITYVRKPLDRLVLLLSRVYPLDAEMVQDLLNAPQGTAAQLLADAETAVYIKVLPDNRISLHDEMRRMVNEYVWETIDPQNQRRKRQSQQAVAYLDAYIKKKQQELDELTEAAKANRDATRSLPPSFIQREEKEQEIWMLNTRYLQHLLFIDVEKGSAAFFQLFDKATQAYRLATRENLLTEVESYLEDVTPERKIQILNRKAQVLFDDGQYHNARHLVGQILENEALSSTERIDNLRLQANLEVRLGDIDQAVGEFTHAVKLAEQIDDQKRLTQSLIGLGWAYRNQGNFTQALEHYTDAYVRSLVLDNSPAMARVLNNMAYIHAYKGDRFSALQNCETALDLWRELNIEREIAITYSTMGEVYRRFSQWEEALEYYDRALIIFADEDDQEWISTVRAGRAAVYMRREEYEQAHQDLEYAKRFGPSNLRPRVLHTEGQFYQNNGDFEAAEALFRECFEVSKRVGDQEFQLRSFADLLDLTFAAGKFDTWPRVKADIEENFKNRSGEETYRLLGSSLRKFGDLAMCAGAYEAAAPAYKRGLPLIAKYEFHEPYAIGEQVRITDERLHAQQVVPALIHRLGKELFTFWREEGLVNESPDPLIIFHRWQQEKELAHE